MNRPLASATSPPSVSSPRSTAVLLAVLSAVALPLLVAGGCTPRPTTCTADDGTVLEEGERATASDGCNVCVCRDAALACTNTVCEPPPPPRDAGTEPELDAGPPADAGLPSARPSNCVDLDEDGFFRCVDEDDPALCDCTDANYPELRPEIDCDDERWFVQPGGFEYPDNNIDDNCNDLVDTEENAACVCNTDSTLGTALASGLDICDDTLISTAFSGDPDQIGVFSDYFGDIPPQRGDCYTVLSTGIAGGSAVGNGSADFCGCGFGIGCSNDPAPINPDSAGVCDLGQLRLTLRPPPNARGFEFDFMFMSAEWPEFLCQNFNDTFYSLVETAAVGGGELSNVSFDPAQKEITVNVGFFEAPRNWTVDMSRTPFGAVENASCGSPIDDSCSLPGYCPVFNGCDPACSAGDICVDLENSGNYRCVEQEAVGLNRAGSGSGWLVTRSPISPDDETITVTFSIHDEGDGIYDSLVIIDSFRWVPYSPPVGTSPKD